MRLAAERPLALPFAASLLLHFFAVAAMLFARAPAREVYAPTNVRVTLTPAPAGPKKLGVVEDVAKTPPKAAAETKAPTRVTPPITKTPVTSKAAPVKVDPATSATRTDPSKTNAADVKPDTKTAKAATVAERAGAGDVGGKGSDLTKATFVGLEFPDEAYLNHIINRIMSNFKNTMPRVAELEFVIRRDGCIQPGLRVVKGSNSSVFDAEARAAIEQAARNCGFTPLPAVWKDEILRIHFKFDPVRMGGG